MRSRPNFYACAEGEKGARAGALRVQRWTHGGRRLGKLCACALCQTFAHAQLAQLRNPLSWIFCPTIMLLKIIYFDLLSSTPPFPHLRLPILFPPPSYQFSLLRMRSWPNFCACAVGSTFAHAHLAQLLRMRSWPNLCAFAVGWTLFLRTWPTFCACAFGPTFAHAQFAQLLRMCSWPSFSACPHGMRKRVLIWR